MSHNGAMNDELLDAKEGWISEDALGTKKWDLYLASPDCNVKSKVPGKPVKITQLVLNAGQSYIVFGHFRPHDHWHQPLTKVERDLLRALAAQQIEQDEEESAPDPIRAERNTEMLRRLGYRRDDAKKLN